MTKSLEEFVTRDWEGWLEGLFLGESLSPAVPPIQGEAYHLYLHRIYSELSSAKSKDNFSKAAFGLLEATPLLPAFSERIYTLLHLMALLRCRGCKNYLTRVILDEVLLGLEYGAQDLHYVSLSVRGEFDVDDEFADFLRSSLPRSQDFRYSLLIFYILSARGARDAIDVLENLLRSVSSKIERTQLAHVLRDVIDRVGCSAFYRWQHAMRDSGKHEALSMFQETLRASIEWEELVSEGDFGFLLAAEAWPERSKGPEEILRIARTASSVGEEYVKKTLGVILGSQGEHGEALAWWLGGSLGLDASRVFRERVPPLVLQIDDKQEPLDVLMPEASLLQGIRIATERRGVRTWN